MQKKLTPNPPKQTEGQRVQGSGLRQNRSFRGLENRIAREHTAANRPPVRAHDRERIDVPAAGAPEHADRAKHTILVPDVENVCPAVVEQRAKLTILLFLHQGEHLRQSSFGFLLATQFGNDGTIK